MGFFSEYEQLKCSICMSIFQDPSRCPCGHTFCRKCIEPWVTKNHTCPEDRQPIKKGDIHEDFVVADVIKSISVGCPHKEVGCSWRGRLCELPQHISGCKLAPDNKPSWLISHEGEQASPVEMEDIDVDYLEKARDAATPPPMSLAMRLLSKNETHASMLRDLITHEGTEMREDILRVASDTHAVESPCLLRDSPGADSDESEEQLDEQRAARQQVLADIGNQLEQRKAKKAPKKGHKGGAWKQSSVTGRWVKG